VLLLATVTVVWTGSAEAGCDETGTCTGAGVGFGRGDGVGFGRGAGWGVTTGAPPPASPG
jgi:hypothetical protein